MTAYDEIEIEDMEWNEELRAFTFACPCGDVFQITKVRERKRGDRRSESLSSFEQAAASLREHDEEKKKIRPYKHSTTTAVDPATSVQGLDLSLQSRWWRVVGQKQIGRW